jgi:hypothetical protein
MRSPDAAKIRNNRAPGPHGGAVCLRTHRGELVGRGRAEIGGQPRPSISARCEVSVGWGQSRAYRVQSDAATARKRAKTSVKLNWQR